jgi:hypothetical protein
MAIVHAGEACSRSAQDLTTIGYQEAVIAFAGGSLREAQRMARQAREAYFEGDAALAAVVAAHAGLLLGDDQGLKAIAPGWRTTPCSAPGSIARCERSTGCARARRSHGRGAFGLSAGHR